MSLQHPNMNKSLPKHLQHARIQKEEDEEQWISGEELCTEGSSDEESKVRDFKKKLRGSAQSSASSLKSRICSSSNASIKEKSDNNSDPSSSKPLEWRPKRDIDNTPSKIDDENILYDIKAERIDTEMKWKTTLEELQYNKNLYKNSNLTETQMDTNKLLYDVERNEYNFEDLINHSEYITDNIVTLDREIETFGTILEGCKKDRMVHEQDICSQINSLNICKVTTQSTDKFHKICNYKRERSVRKKRRKTGMNPKLYSRANKFKMKGRTKMDENSVTKLTKEQSNRLEDLLAENDNNDNDSSNNCFKHTNEQLANIAIIDGKLKTLQENSDDDDDADLNKTSEETTVGGGGGVTTRNDGRNHEWRDYFKMKDDKLRKINNRLKVLQNLKTTEDNNNNNDDNNTEENQQ